MSTDPRTCACCGQPIRDGAVDNPHGTLISMRRGESLCSDCFVVRLDAVCAASTAEAAFSVRGER